MRAFRRRREPFYGVFVKAIDERHYLWRAFDQESEALEIFVTQRYTKERWSRLVKSGW